MGNYLGLFTPPASEPRTGGADPVVDDRDVAGAASPGAAVSGEAAAANGPATARSGHPEVVPCLICHDDVQPGDPVMSRPCCFRQQSTVQICLGCIDVIFADTMLEGGQRGSSRIASTVGRCPICRAYLRRSAAGHVAVLHSVGRCASCAQVRVLINGEWCDACAHGTPMRYECEQCHGWQVMSHPMYRYQAAPREFGTADTWCCQRCGDQRHWRIYDGDLGRVPNDDAPEGWGRRDQWLDDIRRRRAVGA